ncbi:Uncharacterized conserved protein, DUF1800 family [Gemmobacter aquatilis]|uniref:Uncharacterized conserved protein, DUF1800 family n=1 Tax=Gemmobacter aquatilis TaxID=933059 RepID=A0A1H8DLC3_9RHOB|nr:DUF1800 domain-containing protein [Gemmobacter aquatilis]SEN08070.1 Uncharacterized conserved protein, DUF1800 family [Gemmobacter aquatilis]
MPDPADIAAFRFGFGLPRRAGQGETPAALLAALAGPDAGLRLWPAPGQDRVQALARAADRLQREMRKNPGDEARRQSYRQALAAVAALAEQQMLLTLARALDAPDSLRERLVWFWADHFTTVARQRTQAALPGALVDHALRPQVAGRFDAMLRAAVLHPAMLVYLDQSASVGPNSQAAKGAKGRRPGLNENLARELVELHTLGVGAGYGQADVRQMAELLTGLSVDKAGGQVFLPGRAEPGAEHVLGRDYGGEGMAPILAALDDLARRPETARHLARKLAVHFLADTPDAALIDRMAAAYLAQETELLPMYEVLLADPAALAAPMRKARRPQEFLVAALRALGIDGAALLALPAKEVQRGIRLPLVAMAQPWQTPRGPDGWPEAAEDWITPQGLAARIGWAMAAPSRLLPGGLPDPRAFADTALGSLAGETLRLAVSRAETRRDGVALVLAAPEFNRR